MKCVRVHRAQRAARALIAHRSRLRYIALLVAAMNLSACVAATRLLSDVRAASWARQVGARTMAISPSSPRNGLAIAMVRESIIGGPPVVSDSGYNWTNQNIDLCLAACGDILYTHTTPAYFSLDQPRAVTFVYNWRTVSPGMTITLDVKDTNSAKTATAISLKVRDSAGTVLQSVRSTGYSELFFTNRQGSVRRIAVRYGGQQMQSYPTGLHRFTATVKSYYSDSSTDSLTVPVRALIYNERSSPIASGWSVGALQRLHVQSDSAVVLTEGTGTIQFYKGPCWTAPCTYTSPAAEYSVLSTHSARGDGTLYDRRSPDGTVAAFDSAGYLKFYSDRFGNKTSYTYDATTHRVASITDAVGNVTTIAVGGSASSYGGPVIVVTDPTGRVTKLHEDANYDVREITDPTNARAWWSTYFSAHALQGFQDRAGQAWYPKKDCVARGHGVIQPAIMVSGSPYSPVVNYAHVDVSTTACASDYNGNTNGLGYALATPAPSTTPDSARARITDGRGITTAYAVDRYGAPTRIEEPMGRVTIIDRDTMSRPIHTRTPLGHAIALTWSGPDISTTVDSITNRLRTFYFDSRYNLPVTCGGCAPATTDSVDATGKFVVARTVSPNSRTTFKYDSRGRDSVITDPMGHVTRFTYASDQWNNLESVTQPNGLKSVTTFDGAGRPTAVTDPYGNTTTTIWDALNRRQFVVGPLSDTTKFGYDSLFLASVTDARSQVWRYTHNALGWMDSAIDPQTNGQYYGYDPAGNIVSWRNRRAMTTTMAYDSLNRRTSLNTSYGSPNRTTAYSYAQNFTWVRAENAASIDTTFFDQLGRVATEAATHGGIHTRVVSAYEDTLGLRTSVMWNGTRGATYSYQNGQLTGVTEPGSNSVTTVGGYNADRLTGKISYPSGVVDSLGYSSFHSGNMREFTPTGVDQQFQHTTRLDSLGRISERYRYPIFITGQGYVDTSRVYSYDPSGRLTGYSDRKLGNRSCGWNSDHDRVCTFNSITTFDTVTFLYDRVGNHVDSLTTQVDPGDRVRSFRGRVLNYDLDGNITQNWWVGVRNDGYYWNQLSELERVDRNFTPIVLYAYDGFGRRVSKGVISGTDTTMTYYQWDGDHVVTERNSAGSSFLEYGYFPGVDQPHSVTEWSSYHTYPVMDAEGNVAGITAGAVYRYKPFGEMERNDSASAMNPLRFQGRPYDPESELYYFRARYYDPSLRRFMSEDPNGLAGGINPYSLAGNDPVNASDPFGLDGCKKSAVQAGWQTVMIDGHAWCFKPQQLPPVVTTAVGGETAPVNSWRNGFFAGAFDFQFITRIFGGGFTPTERARVEEGIARLRTHPDVACRYLGDRLETRYNSGGIWLSRGLPTGANIGMAAAWFNFPTGVVLLKPEALAQGQLTSTLAHEESHYVLGPDTWPTNAARHSESYAIGSECGDSQ